MKLWSLYRVDSATVEGCIAGVAGRSRNDMEKKKQCKSEVQSLVFATLGRQLCIVLSNSQPLRMKGAVGHILPLKL
jgi:hypothetical protein